jgi:hypothetical protein
MKKYKKLFRNRWSFINQGMSAQTNSWFLVCIHDSAITHNKCGHDATLCRLLHCISSWLLPFQVMWTGYMKTKGPDRLPLMDPKLLCSIFTDKMHSEGWKGDEKHLLPWCWILMHLEWHYCYDSVITCHCTGKIVAKKLSFSLQSTIHKIWGSNRKLIYRQHFLQNSEFYIGNAMYILHI